MTPEQRREHAKFAAQGIAMMRRDDKTQEEKLDFFKAMDDRYPGIGWGVEGMKLKRMWARKAEANEPCPY